MSNNDRREKKLTRREFIKDATIAGAAVAATGILGATPAAAQGVPTKWDKETDVVVVGSGFGKAAAIDAKRAGAEVLLLEKADHPGGLQLVGGDNMQMCCTHVQKREGETRDTLELGYQDEMYSSGYRGRPELLRLFVARGADTVKWLEDLGLEWLLSVGSASNAIGPQTMVPPIKRDHNVKPSPNYPGAETRPDGSQKDGGIALHTVMMREVNRLGIPTLLNHKMTNIYREPNGPVVGVKVATPQGSINIRARKGVVLCTGTWTDNDRMAAAWDPRIVGPDCYGDGGTPFDGKLFVDSSGEGLLAAAEIGAGFSNMTNVAYLYIFYGSRSYFGWEPVDWTVNNMHEGKGLTTPPAFFERTIHVNNDGVRYFNETEGSRSIPKGLGSHSAQIDLEFTASYLRLPQPRNVWAITDADGAAALKWPLDDMKNPNPKVGKMFDAACLAIADSLQELATKMGIPAAALGATVSKYNGFVDAGKDADFGKPMPLSKIAKPPFYGAKASLIRHTQRNGLRVNTKSQVLEQSDQRACRPNVPLDAEARIPHLYAAGEAGDSLGWRYIHRSVGHYITAARIAGENAAKETPVS